MRPPLVLLFVAAAACLVGSCSRSRKPAHDQPPGPPTAATLVGAATVLDVPSIVNLSIDQLSGRLGPGQPLPAGFTDPAQAQSSLHEEMVDSVGFFRYRGLGLVATYNERTRRVTDLLLLGTNEPGLMRRANLELGAAGYLVLPVFEARRPTQLMGLRVVATAPPVR